MLTSPFVLILVGLVLLVVGGEALVRGASRFAGALGVSPIVVGLTVVAFGTSAPEMTVSIGAALEGAPDIAYGNVVGSNIFNVLFILGASALLRPLLVTQKLVRTDVPLMILLSGLVWWFARDGLIGRIEGTLLAAGLAAYILYSIRVGRQEAPAVEAEYAEAFGHPGRPTARLMILCGVAILGGLGVLVLGSRLFVTGAVAIAATFGVSQLVIGLTIVSAGTSLPEVATSLIATWRNERDIAVGNVVGSNLFNILGVLGISAAVSPVGIAVAPAALHFDTPVMVAAALVCLPVFLTSARIDRWEGAVLFGGYLAYATYLVLDAQHHDAAPALSRALLVVLPVVGLILAVSLARELRARSRAKAVS